jgi:hypothetical protein
MAPVNVKTATASARAVTRPDRVANVTINGLHHAGWLSPAARLDSRSLNSNMDFLGNSRKDGCVAGFSVRNAAYGSIVAVAA